MLLGIYRPQELPTDSAEEPDFGQQAKALAAALVAGRNVEVEQKDVDRYGRLVGLVKVDGQQLNELIVRNGYAWVYRQYCKEQFCAEWGRLEENARQQRKGMWANPNITPPWEWRASQRAYKQNVSQSDVPPEVIIGEQQQAAADDSLLSKLGKAISPSRQSNNESSLNQAQFKCDGRTSCSQMTSCEEARFFLNHCPGTKMDGDGDGIPCEKQWCH